MKYTIEIDQEFITHRKSMDADNFKLFNIF